MRRSVSVGSLAAGILLVVLSNGAQAVGWDAFIIRSNPTINNLGPDSWEFVITVGGQKAAVGTNDINGATLGDITKLAVERLDDRTRFASGSGPYTAPYLNVWITDGAGKYAVIANEPSDPDFQPLYSNGYDLDFADLSNKVAKVYEVTDKSWLPNNGVGLTFADLAGFTIQAPTVAELNLGWAGLGTGAPRELGTNVAYGVNWVLGDTLSNYVSGDPGYRLANPEAAAGTAGAPVPEPLTAGLALVSVLAVGASATRRRRAA